MPPASWCTGDDLPRALTQLGGKVQRRVRVAAPREAPRQRLATQCAIARPARTSGRLEAQARSPEDALGLDPIRHVIALFLVVGVAPLLVLWLLVHPIVGFWRRLGLWWTYGAVGAVIVTLAVFLARARTRLLALDFGTHWPLVVAGLGCLAVSARLRLSVSRRVGASLLLGLPELAPQRYPAQLMTDGPYAYLRHPRYVQFVLALLGYALIANHLAAYVVWLAWFVGIHPIVWLEEHELRQRFGAEYEAYCRRVPRFIPRRWRSTATAGG